MNQLMEKCTMPCRSIKICANMKVGWADDGKAPYKDRLLMAYLVSHPYVQSRYAKRECGFSKGYDTVFSRLQTQTYVVMADFQYNSVSCKYPKTK